MSSTATPSPVLEVVPLAFQWPGIDPFLFCVHHLDRYPASAPGSLGVDPKLLRGREIGSDFSGKSGWSHYHGEKLPGFPKHPHCARLARPQCRTSRDDD